MLNALQIKHKTYYLNFMWSSNIVENRTKHLHGKSTNLFYAKNNTNWLDNINIVIKLTDNIIICYCCYYIPYLYYLKIKFGFNCFESCIKGKQTKEL